MNTNTKHALIALIVFLIGSILSTLTALNLKDISDKRLVNALSADIDTYSDYLISETERSLTLLSTLKSYFSRELLEKDTFAYLSKDALQSFKQLHSIYWAPLRESSTANGEKSYVFPIQYSASLDDDSAIGLDISDIVSHHVDDIRREGSNFFMLIMEPLLTDREYVEGEDPELYMFVIMPVYNIKSRLLEGFIVGVLNTNNVIENLANSDRLQDVDIKVTDMTTAGWTVYVAIQEAYDDENLVTEHTYSITRSVFDTRSWNIEGTPSADYIAGVADSIWVVVAVLGHGISLLLSTIIAFLVRSLSQVKDKTRALNAANERLQHIALTDGLTGISNRLAFDKALDTEWGRALRDQSAMSLILLDIDFFKQYNDIYGHPTGDSCLKTFASELSSCYVRPADVVARYGGEEFVVILPNTVIDEKTIIKNCINVIHDLRIEHRGSKVSSYLSVSAGACVIMPSKDFTKEEFIAKADEALYLAKQKSRNTAVVLTLGEIKE